MKNTKLKSPVILAINMCLLISVAYTASVRAEAVIEEVIVTALKREQNLQDIAVSVKAFNEDMLKDMGADSLRDFGRFVPSMSFTNRGGSQNQVLIRGLGPVAGTPTTTMYIDGITSATGLPTSGSFTTLDPNLYDVERVEVLRGPQGTLYGEGSIGGTILIHNKRPDPTKFETSIDLTYSNTKEGGDNYSANAMINIPLLKDRFALRGVIQGRDISGVTDLAIYDPFAVLTNTQGPVTPRKNADDEDTISFRFSIGGNITDDIEIVARYSEQDYETGIFNADSREVIENSPLFAGLGIADGDFVQLNTIDRFFDFKAKTFSSQLDWDFDFASLTLVGGRVFVDAEQNADLTGFGGEAVLDNESTAHSVEARLASNAGDDKFDWIIGMYYKEGERDGQFETAAIFGQDVFFIVESKSFTAYGEAYYNILDNLKLTFGIRYFEEDLDQEDNLSAGFGVLTNSSASFDDISKKVSLQYNFSDDFMAYFTYSEGFRSGQINVNIINDPNFIPQADPDQAKNYELGFKSQWLDNRLTINASGFHIDWTDLQIQGVPGNAALGFVSNAGAASVDGFEADVLFRISEGLDISFGGSYVKAETDNAINSGTSGDRLPNAPKVTFNATGTYRFPIFGSYTGMGRIAYSHRGSSFQSIPNVNTATVSNRADSHDIVDLRLGLESDNWQVYLFVDNLLNSEGSSFRDVDTVGNLAGFVLPGEETFRLRPRTLGINLQANFD